MNYTVYSQDTVRVSFGPGMSIFLDQHAIMSLRQQLDLAAAELIVEEAVIEPLMEAWEDAATPG